MATSFADGSGGDATFVFADYEVEGDPQFRAVGAVGDPEVPDGGLILVLQHHHRRRGRPRARPVRGALAPGEGGRPRPATSPPGRHHPRDPCQRELRGPLPGADRIVPIGEHAVTPHRGDRHHALRRVAGDTGESTFQSDGFLILAGAFVAERAV